MINVICQFLELLIIIVAVTLVVKMFVNAEQATHFSQDIDYRIKLIALSLIGGSVIALLEVFAVLLVMNAKIASSDQLIILILLATAIIVLNVMLMIITAPKKSETETETRKHITERMQYINQKTAYFERQIKFYEMRKTVDELLRKRDDQ